MKRYAYLLLVFVFTCGAFAQTKEKVSGNEKGKNINANIKTSSPLELARETVKVYGGDKFTKMKTLVVRGTADVSGSPTITFPATFTTIYAGEKYRLEISNPFQPLKQVFDGQQTSSSIPNFSLPPLNRLGFPLLAKIDDKSFVVSALPDSAKKKQGFRITAPEGFYTDFFIDEKTNLVKSYESSYEINGRTITTSIAIDKLREVDGVKIPERYAQRFDTRQLTIYADFKAKEILVNSVVADDVFSISK